MIHVLKCSDPLDITLLDKLFINALTLTNSSGTNYPKMLPSSLTTLSNLFLLLRNS